MLSRSESQRAGRAREPETWQHPRVSAPESSLDEAAVQAAVQLIFQGTASETGTGFFTALVENLARALGTRGAWVTELLPVERRLRALAFWLGGEWVQNYEQAIDGTPCQVVVENRKIVHIADRLVELYPKDSNVRGTGAVSYMGVPLMDLDGNILGHLAVMDVKPMPAEPIRTTLFEIFAGRAAAELRRLRAEREVRAREAQLARLVESTMDAIVQLDGELRVTQMNPAAERTFELPSEHALGVPFSRLTLASDAAKLKALAQKLLERPAHERSTWVFGGLTGLAAGGSGFPAEATLSAFELAGQDHFTLILRNVKDRLEAERRIASLTDEAEYLRTELRDLGRSGEIIGQSEKLAQVLAEVRQVGPADTTVLLFGETGTGKELFARALHEASRRREKPLIKVNCAAVPATLIESEFFGHERGAFTGATARRDGRFTLADGGTIFLDEVGELPLELQSKLLRVLQEGEFEPVGSSRTRKVDVRVVAATNRDLQKATAEGKFREDLFYRLNVFPLTLPPLRERGADVVLLAERFARHFAARAGQQLAPLSAEAAARLRRYAWPGNVRELQNVIERAVITATGGQLNLDRALPVTTLADDASRPEATAGALLTAKDLALLERDNLRRALDATGWQIAGDSGAARLLGMAPSTVASRVKALGLRREG
jgi:PAS domain S-box-containing protein